jgi:8-oxo-dGTP pyrophosphatase MutT (NUDIX family)
MTVKQVKPDAPPGRAPRRKPAKQVPLPEAAARLTEIETGILVGLLVGEGHFGGDGRQPQVTLRMHTDHQALFLWLVTKLPGSKLYGPYHHGGRHYFQWMARGGCLRETLIPLLDQHLDPSLDTKTFLRYQEMKRRYGS